MFGLVPLVIFFPLLGLLINLALARRLREPAPGIIASGAAALAFVAAVLQLADLQPSQPDEVWGADITYVRLACDFVYLAVIMDVFTRAVRGWHLSRSLDRELTLTALRRALADRVPEIHHSDQGVQYACGDYTDLLREQGVQISMAAVGKPEENG